MILKPQASPTDRETLRIDEADGRAYSYRDLFGTCCCRRPLFVAKRAPYTFRLDLLQVIYRPASTWLMASHRGAVHLPSFVAPVSRLCDLASADCFIVVAFAGPGHQRDWCWLCVDAAAESSRYPQDSLSSRDWLDTAWYMADLDEYRP